MSFLKWSLVLILMLGINYTSYAQDTKLPDNTSKERKGGKKGDGSGFDASKIFVGGGLGLSFGDVTVIDISPLVGYRFTEAFSAGLGINYQYIRDSRFGVIQKANVYGGRIFSRYVVFKDLYVHGEYEYLRYSYKNDLGDSFKQGASRLPLGGGYQVPIGGSAYLTIEVLYDVLFLSKEDPNEYLFGSPLIIRAGVNIGF